LKAFFTALWAKWKLVQLFFAGFGIWGVGALALIDSSTLPVPMDVFLAAAVWADMRHFWLYCLSGAIGSAIGGLLPFKLGQAGGEAFLLKRVSRERFEKMRDHFERQEFLAMMIPSMLPPPTPWKAFVFAAGVFEMRTAPFMLAVFCGRMLRWLALSWLVFRLGDKGAVEFVKSHAMVTAAAIGGLAVIGFAWWWVRKKRAGKLLED